MPTSTPLFEGQNLISGILETGQNVFASFKPVLILFLGLLFGFFVIYIIIIFLRNILQNRISDEQDRRVIAYDIIDKTINTKYKKEVEGLGVGALAKKRKEFLNKKIAELEVSIKYN